MTSTRVVSAYRNLKNRLVAGFSHTSGQPAIIVVCSRRNGDGASTVCTDLAGTFSKESSGNILLVNHADGRNSGGGRIGGEPLEINSAFLSAFGSASADSPSPAITTRALARAVIDLPTLTDSVLGNLRAELFNHYSVVIVDAGSILQDKVYYWSRIADQLLLVIDASHTTSPELEYCKNELAQAALNIDGIILNRKPFYVPGFFYRHFG